ncbi:hypothetical protein RKE29_22135, partial [Streptomyces sp. B1866]|nr:hypothetical protein [Streptomyces sp. B1866]
AAPGHGDGAPPSHRAGGRSGGRRRLSRPAVIGIVVAVCAVAGLATGAVLSSQGGDDGKSDGAGHGKGASADPGTGDGAGQGADPAQAQAKALDALLADSNDSRSSVISAVENIKACQNLPQAATDLRTAAGQRSGLVERLGRLSVDRLPGHARLTAALTTAWQSSAAADNHYAAWAGQVGDKKGCHKGKARRTPQMTAAEVASAQATVAKKQAAALWNPIADQHGLTRRDFSQL